MIIHPSHYPENQAVKSATLVELLQYRAQCQSESAGYTFLENGNVELDYLTYQKLDQQARAIATQLQSCLAPSERALLLYPPGLEFICAFFGCLYAGIVAVPAYPPRPNQSLSRLKAIMADAQVAIVLTTRSLLGNIEQQLAEIPELTILSCLATDNLDTNLAVGWQEPAINGTTLAFLQYTSGSTGTPKGVIVSHSNLLHNQEMIKTAFGHTNTSVVVGWLPLFHDMGLIGNVLQPLYLGTRCILMSPITFLQQPINWLQAVSHYQATTSGGPNFAYDLCVRKITPEQRETLDLSNWEVAFNGAEPVRVETLEKFAATFAACGFRREAFYPCYGMAETTLFVSGGWKTAVPKICVVDGIALEQNQVVIADDKQENTRKIVSCGQTWSDTKVAIVDTETLQECPPGQIGEIWVSGSSVTQGYWNRQTETEYAFQAYLSNTGAGPFLRTGDLGFIQAGELFITGRLKDVIIIRGRNHYPQDIEITVENSHPALRPGCGAAFSVENKGEEKLVIVSEVERSYLRKLDVKDVVGNIRQSVASQHGLYVYAVVLVKPGSIPKTSSGKIQRSTCREKFITGGLMVVEDWSENPQVKTKFLHLQAEIEGLSQQVQTANTKINI